MQVIRRLPPGNTSYIIHIKNICALKYLDHETGIDDVSEVRNAPNTILVIPSVLPPKTGLQW